jgi:bifunctional non-homologous end joining protein LigD
MLKVRSRLIDGEAVVCDENGLAVFERLRQEGQGRHVFLYAFDLLELDGKDLRREPLEVRKATLRNVLRGYPPGVRLNEHLTHPGDVVFRHACKMGCEGTSRSVSAPSTAPADRRTGSSSRTRMRRQRSGRPRRTGEIDC